MTPCIFNYSKSMSFEYFTTQDDWTPLMSSVHAGYDIILKELVLLGADVDATNSVSQHNDRRYISYLFSVTMIGTNFTNPWHSKTYGACFPHFLPVCTPKQQKW